VVATETANDVVVRRTRLEPSSQVLLTALTHSSYAAEYSVPDNERLEFLGDAVVDLATAEFILLHRPELTQGEATYVRSRVVNETALAGFARQLALGDALRVNRGVKKEGGLDRNSILADAFEAVVAAVFMESGYVAARDFVWEFIRDEAMAAAGETNKIDYKGRLTKLAHERSLGSPRYEVDVEGPSHLKVWRVVVHVGDFSASAESTSKKGAELAAAQSLVEKLDA
jgi:ribonuclease-3